MKPLQLTKQQQFEFSQKFNTEMERMIMSWDNVLRDWHPIAIKALDFANVRVLNIPQNRFIELFNEQPQGIGMNVIMALCNNLEDRSGNEMGYSGKEWAEVLLINHQIATRWQALSAPVQQKLYREFEIMNNKVPGLQIIKAEA